MHLVAAEPEGESDVVGHAQELSERHSVLAADAQLLHQGDGVLDAGLVVRGHHDLGAVALAHVLQHQGDGGVVAGMCLLDRLRVVGRCKSVDASREGEGGGYSSVSCLRLF